MIYSYMEVYWKVINNTGKDIQAELLDDYFVLVDKEEKVDLDFCVELLNSEFKGLKEVLEFGDNIVIHSSKKPEIHEIGIGYDNGFTRIVYNQTTKTVYKLNYLNRKITIYNKDISAISRDYIRIVRDITKVMVEKKGDSVLLHAAALQSPTGQGLLLIGGKKSGKTTTSLNLIYNYGFTEVSRDRTFVSKDTENAFIMNGWPNYYNLTMKTLVGFQQTKNLLPNKYMDLSVKELEDVNEKVQFLPQEINITKKKNVAPLTHLVVLHGKNEKSSDLYDTIAANCYTPNDLNNPNWHNWDFAKNIDRKNAIDFVDTLIKKTPIIVSDYQEDIGIRLNQMLEGVGNNERNKISY